MRFILQTMNPWSVMWLRMVVPMVLLLPLAGRLKHCHYRRGDWKLLIPIVLFQPCLYFLLESNALRMTTSIQAGVIKAKCSQQPSGWRRWRLWGGVWVSQRA